MKKNCNSGFSLIELVITLAIMAIVVTISVVLYNLINNAQLKKGSKDINAQISVLRTKTMSKEYDWKMEIKKSGGQYVSVISYYKTTIGPTGAEESTWVEDSKKKLGNDVKIYCSDGGTKYYIGDGSGNATILIKFNKSSGSFNTAQCLLAGGTSFNIEQIGVEKGSDERVIKLVLLTGKHYIK